MKNINKLILSLVLAVLCFSVAFSNQTSFVVTRAYDIVSPYAGGTNNNQTATAITLPSRVELGKTIALTDLNIESIQAPSGKTLELGTDYTTDGLIPTQQGHYLVTLNDGDITTPSLLYKDYSIYVYAKRAPILEIEHNGAKIPSVTDQGKEIDLPKAWIVYYNDDNERVVLEDDLVTTSTSGKILVDVKTEGAAPTITGNTPNFKIVTPDANTTLFITYSYFSDEHSLISRDFKVRVQKDFLKANAKVDTKKPDISVSTPASTASVNTKVTLAKASATDNYDENVQVDVTVTYTPSGTSTVQKVKVANVNHDTGYAEGLVDPAADVYFDNDRNMFFYPTEETVYYVEYKVTDDSDNFDIREFKITVSDKELPVIKEIDDWRIPTRWGLDVSKATDKDDDTPKNINDGITVEIGDKAADYRVIQFPVPDAIDNKTQKANLTCSFTIINSKSTTLYSVTNIFAAPDSADAKNTITGTGHDGRSFDEGFSFNLYNGAVTDVLGEYTATYKVKDEAGQIRTSTYKIELVSSFSDVNFPSVRFEDTKMPNYIVADNRLNIVIPTPTISDMRDTTDGTSRPRKEYMIYSFADKAASEAYFINPSTGTLVDSREIKGGEVIKYNDDHDIDSSEPKYLLDGEEFDLGGYLTLTAKATDNVGNSTEGEKQNVVVVDSAMAAPAIAFANDDDLADPTVHAVGNNSIYEQGEEINLGGLTINYTEYEQREFVGFEVSIREPETLNLCKNVEVTSYNKQNVAEIVIESIKFTPSKFTSTTNSSSRYMLTIRAFHINGKNMITTKYFEVVENTSDEYVRPGSANQNISKNIEINKEVALDPTLIVENDPNRYSKRVIAGPVFTLMGDTFVARQAGVYSFEEWSDHVNPADAYRIGEKVFSTASDSTAPQITLVAPMATYLEKDTVYLLPQAVASNANTNAKFDKPVVRYSTANMSSQPVAVTGSAMGDYRFTASTSGTYTVTYTAKIGDKSDSKEFTIRVGDVTAPVASLQTSAKSRMNLGDKFDFSVVICAEDTNNEYTYTKKLIAPNKSTETVTGRTRRNKDGTSFVLDQSGDYEVVYEITDKSLNTTTIKETISINPVEDNSPFSLAALSTILIIVAILLIAFMVVYAVRFRKVKE